MEDDMENRLTGYLELYKRTLPLLGSERFARACVEIIGEGWRLKPVSQGWAASDDIEEELVLCCELFAVARSLTDDQGVVETIVKQVAKDLRIAQAPSDQSTDRAENSAVRAGMALVQMAREKGCDIEAPKWLTRWRS